MAAILAEDVARRYGDAVAVDGVSLEVAAGEVFALVGPNGAGKTTLVRALVGTTDAEGRVELFGSPPDEVARERIGLLPQAFDPPARLTARELVDYYASLYDQPRSAESVLADVGLEALDTHYENLSGGQQRRTCVATALVNGPDLLVLDEPTTGVDPAGRRAIWNLLTDQAATGATVLLTTHYMEEAQELADRVGLLDGGSLLAVDTPAQLVRRYGGDNLLRVTGVDADADLPDLGYGTECRNGRLTVRGVEPATIGDVVDALETADVEYESLTWTEPDLEDVYLELTGRRVTGEGDPVEGVV